MINLSKKPFNLKKEDIKWVTNTIEDMTLDEKIGQLFIGILGRSQDAYVKDFTLSSKAGGFRYTARDTKTLKKNVEVIKKNSKVPPFIIANAENGGKGAVEDGTYVGFQLKVAATNDSEYAQHLGEITAHESKVAGANMIFSPIVDITKNWRNPIIQTRAWGEDPNLVLEYSKQFIKGAMKHQMVSTVKHFPGDGIDERDHHLSFSVNDLSKTDWDNSFGKVYKGLIDDGLASIMIGHIMLPSYERHFNPNIKDEELMPATLSKPLLNNLLREELNFNGLIITDASHMVGLTGRTSRKFLVPASIEAGCDMFLFHNDLEEDLYYMKEGLKSGILSEKRLNEALTRILGLKASMGLHLSENNELELSIDNKTKEQYLKISDEIADRAITLAKSVGELPIPLSVKKHKRILLVSLEGDNPINSILKGNSKVNIPLIVKEELSKHGFEVDIYKNEVKELVDKMNRLSPEEYNEFMKDQGKIQAIIYGGKSSVEELKEEYDLVIILANINAEMQTINRIAWTSFKGGFEKPWYVNEIPTIFVSFNSPFHLADVPQVKTLINCYDAEDNTINYLIKKLIGESPFHGVSPVDVFCGFIDTKI